MEEDWLRYGVTARRTRNQRRLAVLHALRRKRREHRGATGTARLEAAQADLSGRLVAAAEGISKAYGDHLVVRNFSVRVMRGNGFSLGICADQSLAKSLRPVRPQMHLPIVKAYRHTTSHLGFQKG
jgi:ATPase subunit of ABC transporter with duplicated ATPase domains